MAIHHKKHEYAHFTESDWYQEARRRRDCSEIAR